MHCPLKIMNILTYNLGRITKNYLNIVNKKVFGIYFKSKEKVNVF